MPPKKFMIVWLFCNSHTVFSQIFSEGFHKLFTEIHQRLVQISKSQKKKIISGAKILKAKTKESGQNNLCFSYHFRTFLPSSAKHFLIGSSHESYFKELKPVRKWHFWGKWSDKTTGLVWLKQFFWSSLNAHTFFSLFSLELNAYVSLKVTTICHLKGKNSSKINIF